MYATLHEKLGLRYMQEHTPLLWTHLLNFWIFYTTTLYSIFHSNAV